MLSNSLLMFTGSRLTNLLCVWFLHYSRVPYKNSQFNYGYLECVIPGQGIKGRYRCCQVGCFPEKGTVQVELENGTQLEVSEDDVMSVEQHKAAILQACSQQNNIAKVIGGIILDVSSSDCRSLKYVPSDVPGKAVIEIDGRPVHAPIHPVTIAKKKTKADAIVRPREKCTPDMVGELRPLDVGPELGEIVHLKFANGLICTVLYAKQNSVEASLRHIYNTCQDNKDKLHYH